MAAPNALGSCHLFPISKIAVSIWCTASGKLTNTLQRLLTITLQTSLYCTAQLSIHPVPFLELCDNNHLDLACINISLISLEGR